MSKGSILVVDDDQSIRSYLSNFLASCGYTVDSLNSGEEAVYRLGNGNRPNLMILDMRLPGMDGLEVLARLKSQDLSVPVIILSGVGQIKTVVDAIKMGASDYLVKPFEEEALQLAIENVLEKQELKNEVQNLRQQLNDFSESDIVTTDPIMLRAKEIARQVAETDVPILLLGESGVGKEVIARFTHAQSHRGRTFVKVNCAALPDDLLESELFGYERGAFTGAVTDKPGKFELAGKGTILLDEIGEMNQHLQAKLLHVLQDGEFVRLGGRKPVQVNCRILTATNRKLSEMVSKGEFREDLYYRINVISIEIPPLRERREDIPLLSNYFLKQYASRYNSSVQQLPDELVEIFYRYNWPGNVRQLQNVIKRYVILPDMSLALSEFESSGLLNGPAPHQDSLLKDVSAQAAETAEREMVLRALEETHWNRKQAARQLGICYKALLNKLKKWQLRQPSGTGTSRSLSRES